MTKFEELQECELIMQSVIEDNSVILELELDKAILVIAYILAKKEDSKLSAELSAMVADKHDAIVEVIVAVPIMMRLLRMELNKLAVLSN